MGRNALYTLWLYIIYNSTYFLLIVDVPLGAMHLWDSIAPIFKEFGGQEHEL
jgi:hypothetical protein